ncbi:pre-mRNA-splicing factor cwc22 [Coemansia pectinata]|uniref:Pre-mRNA-splicing factor cwc22 n=1 Tax=Coemansia pectinata TaxID=1052879 RepID=A0A9W8H2M5_9FUNG|nr:pre-mRNA-splicing factor cwc22 [Coemansia pectinata]
MPSSDSEQSDSSGTSSAVGERRTKGGNVSPPRSVSPPLGQKQPGGRERTEPARQDPLILVKSGRYLPPALKRKMLAAQGSSTDEAGQRASWESLKKKINGPVNKVNTSNIKDVIVELFSANLIRGRGLYCRSLMRAQTLSTSFTPVYAALTAVINTKLPIVGELLVTRLVIQFRRAFHRDDKDLCISSVMFLAHLTNQRIAHEVLAFQVVSLLLETPTDDSVEVAVAFMREVGAFLAEIAPRVLNAVFDTFRSILHEAEIDKRVQYMIEVLFQIRRDGFKDSPPIRSGLDLVEEDEQIVHEVALDDEDLDALDELNVFKIDDAYEENERKYVGISREILGGGSDSDEAEAGAESDSESGSASESESGSESEANGDAEDSSVREPSTMAQKPGVQKIHDLTETEKVNLRRTIYLTIMSSLSFDEAAHKLLKIEIRPGEEQELCNMVIESCSQERTYKAFFGLIGERLCKLNRTWGHGFALAFASCYESIHRYETNHLRNIAHFFAHLLVTGALHLSVLQVVVLTEESTTSSSRIFLKIVLQDMAEELGMKTLNDRLKSADYKVAEAVKGMFPSNNVQTMRFAINYYTSIGLGAITEEMREQIKELPLLTAGDDSDSGSGSDSSSGSSSGSYSSSSSSSGSHSDSDTDSSSGSSASYSSSSSRSRSPRRDSRRSPLRKMSQSPRNRRRSHSRSSPKRLPDTEARPIPVTPAAVLNERPAIASSIDSEKGKAVVRDSRSRSPQPNTTPETRRPRVRSPSYSPAASAMSRSPERTFNNNGDNSKAAASNSASGRASRSPLPSRKRYRSRSPNAGTAEHEVRNMDRLSLRDGASARGRDSEREKGADSRSRSPPRRRRSPSYSRSPSPRAGYDRSRGRDEYRPTRSRYSRDRSRDVYRRERGDRSGGGKSRRDRSYSRSRSPFRYRSSYRR